MFLFCVLKYVIKYCLKSIASLYGFWCQNSSFKTRLCHFLAVWSWLTYIPSLCLIPSYINNTLYDQLTYVKHKNKASATLRTGYYYQQELWYFIIISESRVGRRVRLLRYTDIWIEMWRSRNQTGIEGEGSRRGCSWGNSLSLVPERGRDAEHGMSKFPFLNHFPNLPFWALNKSEGECQHL